MRNSCTRSTSAEETSPASQSRPAFLKFLERYSIILCVGLATVASVRIASTYSALSLTADEPFHLACAIEYLSNHTITLDMENPPLARAVEALGIYTAGARPAGKADAREEGPMVLSRMGNFDRSVFLFRLGTLPFFLMACFVVGWWANHGFGRAAAVIAVALFTLLPTALANAGLGTTDTATAATIGTAFVAAIRWAEKPNWRRAVLMGCCVAFAFLSKLTAIGYVGLTFCLAALAYWLTSGLSWRGFLYVVRRRLPSFVVAVTVTVFVIWAAYWFSFGPIWKLGISLPAPEFFRGIHTALLHNQRGHEAFLLGEYRKTGWWYYFPVALLVKTPIGFLVFLVIGLMVCIRQHSRIEYLLPLAFVAGIMLPAMRGHIDIGVRHVAPAYLAFSVIAAVGLIELLQVSHFRRPVTLVATALLVWMIVSGALRHPNYLAYFNELAGKHPENILDDSNYDWGQGLKLLSKRLHQLGARHITLGSLDGTMSNDYRQDWYELPPIVDINDRYPTPGWTAVSATFEESYRFQLPHYAALRTPWYNRVKPTEQVGPYFLYYTPGPGEPALISRSH
jgi:hypothetical protein